MRIVIRADSSLKIGTGHVMRCLTLAEQLRNNDSDVAFVCRELPGNIISLIKTRGYRVHCLPYKESSVIDDPQGNKHWDWPAIEKEFDAAQTENILKNIEYESDWLVVDHYALNWKWEIKMRPHVNHLMVIDDLADRKHDCDILLDQNYFEQRESRYNDLVPKPCRLLLGPKYALLRSEFIEIRKNLRHRDGHVRRILIFFGGSDLSNETGKAMEAIASLERSDLAVDVVLGISNPHKKEIMNRCRAMQNVVCHYQVDNMAQLMSDADLAIGAGGTTTWERLYLGLPSIIAVLAENQREVTEALTQRGVVWNLGKSSEIKTVDIARLVALAMTEPVTLQRMRQMGQSLFGNTTISGAEKVVQAMSEGIYAPA
ncbi:MAG: UDP-2,4-diacetamido-2,4,6-trideoxy-beta-L-altropyranose hydrolase [candidate division Zixibacteria bacterium]|nr:UDP-2,4-diacetamido-2,4,6-trideoxy-beta-L-altropyranose hydrolase [candidate division Zixibacteria bacterium]